MISKSFVSRLAIMSRRKGLAAAIVYGLSLSVRFTSAAGEEVEIPPQPAQRSHALISIVARDSSRLAYQDWSPKFTRPVVFRQGWPPSSAASGCIAP